MAIQDILMLILAAVVIVYLLSKLMPNQYKTACNTICPNKLEGMTGEEEDILKCSTARNDENFGPAQRTCAFGVCSPFMAPFGPGSKCVPDKVEIKLSLVDGSSENVELSVYKRKENGELNLDENQVQIADRVSTDRYQSTLGEDVNDDGIKDGFYVKSLEVNWKPLVGLKPASSAYSCKNNMIVARVKDTVESTEVHEICVDEIKKHLESSETDSNKLPEYVRFENNTKFVEITGFLI